MMPTHVVVDTTDGYTFKNGSDGVLFDQRHATAFAAQRNADLKPAYRGAYQVFRLVDPVDPEQDNQLYDEWRAKSGYVVEGFAREDLARAAFLAGLRLGPGEGSS